MSLKRAEKIVNTELDSIMSETREYRCFSLGFAYGYYSFYKSFAEEYGTKTAKRCFAGTLEGTDQHCLYFKQLVDADEESDTEATEIYEKYRRLRRQHIDEKQL